MPQAEVLIVGAGAAGLSTAGALSHRGISAVLLERDAVIGGSWARRYDGLHLHTIRQHSGLAHFPIARDRPRYLARDEFVTYLGEYAQHFALQVVTGCAVHSIRPASMAFDGWNVTTAMENWRARVVIVASGQYATPLLPEWPGREAYRGELGHSIDYRNATPYVGRRVLVVGAGNSGAEIASDLARHGAAAVSLSMRSVPPLVPRDPFGMPVQRTSMLLSRLPRRLADGIARVTARLVLGDLSRHGMPPADWQPYSAGRVPVIDVGLVRALKRGTLRIRPALTELTEHGAVFANGRTETFDAIIAATGFGTGLSSFISAPGVLDEHGEPLAASGEPTAQPGLFFIGYTRSLRGHLFEANLASKRLARHVARYLDPVRRRSSTSALRSFR